MASAPINLQDAGVQTPAPSTGSKVGGFLHGLLSAASGLPSTTPSVDPTTGQTVNTPVQYSTGDMFKSMFAGMLTGLAGGVRANQSGAHGALGALGGGFNAERVALANRDALANQQAQEQFRNQQEVVKNLDQHKLNQLAMVRANQDIAANSLKMARLKVQMSADDADRLNKFQQQVSSVPGATFAGFHASGADLMNDPKVGELIKNHANGTLISTPVVGKDANGNPVVSGIESYIVPKAALDSPTTEPVTYYQEEPGKDGTVKYTPHTIPAGSMTLRESMLLQQKQLSGLITPSTQFQQEQENKRVQFQQQEEDKRANLQAQTQLKLANEKAHEFTPEQIGSAIDLVGKGKVDLNTLRYMEKSSSWPDILQGLKDRYPGWNEAQFKAGLKLREYYTSGVGVQRLDGGQNAIQHMALLSKIMDKIPTGADMKSVNKAVAYWAKQFGDPSISSYDQLVHDIAPEFGKLLKGGKPDKEEQERLDSDLDPSKPLEARKAALNNMAHVLYQNLDTIANDLKNGIPGIVDDPNRPRISPGAEAALKHFGLDNPFNYSKVQRGAPAVGEIQQGYRFNGGNPADPKSWSWVGQ